MPPNIHITSSTKFNSVSVDIQTKLSEHFGASTRLSHLQWIYVDDSEEYLKINLSVQLKFNVFNLYKLTVSYAE